MTAASGLRKRVEPFVKVPSSTIRDGRLSYRARGLLVYLLDLPDGWDVRSEQIAAQAGGSKGEGREAVRTALKELAECGYYRIERRQMRSGRFTMGTAISEKPDPVWAEEFAEFKGKPVLCVEQGDDTFMVKRADGTLTPDGFEGIVSAGHTGDGFPGAGEPVTGDPESGEPGSGEPGALSSTDTQDIDADNPTSLRSVAPSAEEEPSTDGASATRAIGVDANGEPSWASTSTRKVRLPREFYVTEHMKAWWREKGMVGVVDGVEQTERFCEFFWANGGTKVDWRLAWQTWMRKAFDEATGMSLRSRPTGGPVQDNRHQLAKDDPHRAAQAAQFNPHPERRTG